MKNKNNRLFFILLIVAVITTISIVFIYRKSKQSNTNQINIESSIDDTITMEELVQQATQALDGIKEPTDSEFITLFDKYSLITLKSPSLEKVEDGVYRGIVEIVSPNFEDGFNQYVAEHDDNEFQEDNYYQILDDILSKAERNTSELEMFFYLDADSHLSPILSDDVINALYGNLPDVYYDKLMESSQKGEQDEN